MPQVQLDQPSKRRQPPRLAIAVAIIVLGAVVVIAALLSMRLGQLNTPEASPAPTTQAASPSLYLKPNSGTFSPGSTITVEVRENSLTIPVNAVQANLSYPADKLEFKSIDGTTSAFGIAAEAAGGNGLVKIARGTITPATRDQAVAKITFTVKASSGAADLAFASGSSLVASSSNTNIAKHNAGATYQIR